MTHLYALCVARHQYIADHLARFFAEVGVDSAPAIGLQGALDAARERAPDVVVCEYELLVTLPLDAWEGDATLRRTPVVAVSLTRQTGDTHPLDANGIAGFLYLPRLQKSDASRLLHAAAMRPRYTPGSSTVGSRAPASP